jgi:hypothetical protein
MYGVLDGVRANVLMAEACYCYVMSGCEREMWCSVEYGMAIGKQRDTAIIMFDVKCDVFGLSLSTVY